MIFILEPDNHGYLINLLPVCPDSGTLQRAFLRVLFLENGLFDFESAAGVTIISLNSFTRQRLSLGFQFRLDSVLFKYELKPSFFLTESKHHAFLVVLLASNIHDLHLDLILSQLLVIGVFVIGGSVSAAIWGCGWVARCYYITLILGGRRSSLLIRSYCLTLIAISLHGTLRRLRGRCKIVIYVLLGFLDLA